MRLFFNLDTRWRQDPVQNATTKSGTHSPTKDFLIQYNLYNVVLIVHPTPSKVQAKGTNTLLYHLLTLREIPLTVSHYPLKDTNKTGNTTVPLEKASQLWAAAKARVAILNTTGAGDRAQRKETEAADTPGKHQPLLTSSPAESRPRTAEIPDLQAPSL